MVIYEVNLVIDEGGDGVFESWLRDHVREMLGFEGFTNAEILRQKPDDLPDTERGRSCWTVLYRVRDRSALDNYLTEHARRMRQEGLVRFSDLKASRRIHEVV